ncbi:MAG: hypothetical protein ACI82I_001308, partial [Gammaproteobacteria bacterium]
MLVSEFQHLGQTMIKHDWILSVLDDLQLYAEENGL